MARKRRSFTAEFKAEAVRLCKVGDRTMRQVAKELDLTETALRGWVKRGVRRRAGARRVDDGGARGARAAPQAREATADGARHPKKSGGLLREGEHVKFAFIEAEKARYPVAVLCEALDVSRSGFYAWQRALRRRRRADAQLVVEIKAAMKRGRGAYGSPRVHRELRANGVRVSKKRVERLMRENGLVARQKRRFGTRPTRGTRTRSRPTCWSATSTASAQPSLGRRRDVHRDRRGLVVLGRPARPLLASRRRLGDEREQRPRARPPRSRKRCECDVRDAASCTTPIAEVPTPATTTAAPSRRTPSSRA